MGSEGIGHSACRSSLEARPGWLRATANEGPGPLLPVRFRAGRGLAQGRPSQGERPKGTNTKVLVEISRPICRDIVGSTDRLEETQSAALLMCCPDKKRIAQDASASASPDNADLSEMSFGIVREIRFSGGVRVS